MLAIKSISLVTVDDDILSLILARLGLIWHCAILDWGEEQYNRINDLAKLVAKSDVYSSQIEKYNKALIETRKLIEKAKQLERLYISLVREGLIGIKISSYHPDKIINNLLIHHLKYEQLREEYQ